MTFTVLQDRKLIRTRDDSKRYVLARVEAPIGEKGTERVPINLAIVIDRSGSMHGGKLDRALEAACYAIERLRDRDRFAVIAYDDEVEVVVSSTAATPEARRAAVERIRRIQTGGSTNLFDGWLRGCQQVAEFLRAEDLGRCLLLTDGLANRGVTDQEEIVAHAGNLRLRHIVTSTFGIGTDFDEGLLSRIAAAAGGNFYYIASAADIPKYIDQETGESLEIVARDASIGIEADPACEVESLNDYPLERTPFGWRVALGSLTSGQVIEPLFRVRFPRGESGAGLDVRMTLSARDEALRSEPLTLCFTYALDADNEAQPRDRQVDLPVARVYAARAQREAVRHNRNRDYEGARRIIDRCLDHIRAYAGTDADLLAIVAELVEARHRLEQRLDGDSLKQMYSRSDAFVRDRSSLGYAKRRARGNGIVLLPATADLAPICRAAASALEGLWGSTVRDLDVDESLLGTVAPARVLGVIDEIRLATRAYHDLPGYAVRIVVTDRLLEDNWFSHWHAGQQTAIVSLHDWNDLSRVSAIAFVAQEIVLNGLHALSSQYDIEALAHEETRGCLYDFCGDKRDLEIKLQTMDVCPECRGRLSRMRVDTDKVLRLCAVVRDLATRPAAA